MPRYQPPYATGSRNERVFPGAMRNDAALDCRAVSAVPRQPLPRPPRELAGRVFAVGSYSDLDRSYDELGAQTKRQLVRMLPDEWSFEGKRILDFGSGAGRTLRHFAAEAEIAEFWGADIDEPSISWMEQNLCPCLLYTSPSPRDRS